MRLISFLVFSLLLLSCAHTPEEAKQVNPWITGTNAPKRLVILVFDHLTPALLERYPLPNFARLSSHALKFPNAYVGHLATYPVISNQVILTGLSPRKLPIQDIVFRDTQGLLGKKNKLHTTFNLNIEQLNSLANRGAATSLLNRENFKMAPQLVVGQDPNSLLSFPGSPTTSFVTIGYKRKKAPLLGWCAPDGLRVPQYILEPGGGRFFIDCNPTYGSEASLLPLEGNRFVPGKDSNHLGGDKWVGDAVIQFMNSEPQWKAVVASFQGIDRSLRMLAEHYRVSTLPWAVQNELTVRTALFNADAELGKILDKLEKSSLLAETLILVTSGHGGQLNNQFHGNPAFGHELNYLINGKGENFDLGFYAKELSELSHETDIEAFVHDSAFRIFLKSKKPRIMSRMADKLRLLPGVAEVYSRKEIDGRSHYIRMYRSTELKGREMEWSKKHASELLETFAHPNAPEVVALLFDGHGYGYLGDSGGGQEAVQRIPLLLWSPNLKTETSAERDRAESMEVRLMDIEAIVTRLMDLPKVDTDGSVGWINSLVFEPEKL